MIDLKRLCFLSAGMLFAVAACAGNTVYRSVDEEGHVTYSTAPPENAVAAEAVRLPPGPSAQTTEQAIERVREMEQKTDAQFEALTKRRQEEAQARRDAERLRLEKETAERRRRSDEAAEWRSRGPAYYPVYPPYWGGIYPPRPPVHLPHPPEPSHPIVLPHRRSHSHINPPTRLW